VHEALKADWDVSSDLLVCGPVAQLTPLAAVVDRIALRAPLYAGRGAHETHPRSSCDAAR
jgi:hypothetical protein